MAGLGLGLQTCCCKKTPPHCEHFFDHFLRPPSTDLGPSWIEVQGDQWVLPEVTGRTTGFIWFPDNGIAVIAPSIDPGDVTDWAFSTEIFQLDLFEYPFGSGWFWFVDNIYRMIYNFCDPQNYSYFNFRLVDINFASWEGKLKFSGGSVENGVDLGESTIKISAGTYAVGEVIPIRICSLQVGQWGYEVGVEHATICGGLGKGCNSPQYGPVGLGLITSIQDFGGYFDLFSWDIGRPKVYQCAPCGCYCHKSLTDGKCMPDTLTATIFSDGNCPNMDGLTITLTNSDEDKQTWKSDTLGGCPSGGHLELNCMGNNPASIACNFCLSYEKGGNIASAAASPCPDPDMCKDTIQYTAVATTEESTCNPLRLVFQGQFDGEQSGPAESPCCGGEIGPGFFHIEITE